MTKEQHEATAEEEIPELVWHMVPEGELVGSDRVAEQHGAVWKDLLVWVELHRLDDNGLAYKMPHWVVWFQRANDLTDVFPLDGSFTTEAEAKEAVRDALGSVKFS